MRVADIRPGPEGYLLLFGWVFAEQIGLPLPAAPALLGGGALAAGGNLNAFVVVVVASAASVLADFLWYRAGSCRSDVVGHFLRRYSDSRILRSVESLATRYGSRSLLFAKFVPGLSLAAPPLSGICGTSATRFLLFDSLGSLLWAGSFTGIGYFFGSTITSVAVPRLWIWLWAALAIGSTTIAAARGLWRKSHEQPPIPEIDQRSVRIYKQEPAELRWLVSVITGNATSDLETAVGPFDWDNTINPFFAGWIATWSRKLVIAKALGKVANELKHSACQTVSVGRPAGVMPPPEWSCRHPLNKFQLERALAAIDIFPRCALLLTIFERLSLEDTVILLGADKKLVTAAQAIGLTELARNLANQQGWMAERDVSPRPTLEAVQQTI
jgi:membrane protein DedA with SNARE-associated domain